MFDIDKTVEQVQKIDGMDKESWVAQDIAFLMSETGLNFNEATKILFIAQLRQISSNLNEISSNLYKT